MTLHIQLLGPPSIILRGSESHVDTRKAIALLAYLILNPGRHSRDRIALLFWPDSDQHNARASLRRTLSTMNKAIDAMGTDADRDTIVYKAHPDTRIDIVTLRGLLAAVENHEHASVEECERCTAALEEADTLYDGDFLEGFALKDCPEFDDWQYIQNETLRRQMAEVYGTLAHTYVLRHAFDEAAIWAQKWLRADPLHEPAHRWLMRVYTWGNQRSAALKHYRECVRILDDELGVEPLTETVDLYALIKEEQLEPPPDIIPAAAPLAASAPPSAESLPLVGREAELDILTQGYQQSQQTGHVAVIVGEAGIGKTRLLQDFTQTIQSDCLARVRCHSAEVTLAYGPITTILRELVTHATQLESFPGRMLAEVARLLPELSHLLSDTPDDTFLSEAMARTRFFDGVADFLLEIARRVGHTMIIIDDAHWADSASQDLLAYVMHRLADVPLYIVLTWRPDMLTYDSPLNNSIMTGQRAGWATALSLNRLSVEAVESLVRQQNLPDHAAQLYKETEGLPFFIAEYLRQLDMHADDLWALPHSVQDLLRARLVDVGDVERQLLSTAAVIGRSFDFDTLREASGRSEEETVTMLEALLQRGLIQEDDNLTYDFYHNKLRTLLYEETSVARRRLLHRRVARIIERRIARYPEWLGQAATHFEHAREDELAATYYIQAAEYARQSYAIREALNHYQSALALDAPNLHEAIGDMQMLLGAYPASLHSYETAAAQADRDDLSRIEHKIGHIYHRLGDWGLAESSYQEALAVTTDAGQRARILADRSLIAHRQGDADRAFDLATAAIDQAGDDNRALAQAHNLLGVIARSHGELDTARTHLETSMTLAETLNDLSTRVAALNNLALVCGATGDTQEAITLTQQALTICQQQGDRHREAALYSNLADLYHQSGDEETSMRHLKESVTILADIGAEAGQPNAEIWMLFEW